MSFFVLFCFYFWFCLIYLWYTKKKLIEFELQSGKFYFMCKKKKKKKN